MLAGWLRSIQDWDRNDAVTCESVGQSIADKTYLINTDNGKINSPNRCINTMLRDTFWSQALYGNQGSKNWYQQVDFGNSPDSKWMQSNTQGRNNNLTATYIELRKDGKSEGIYDYLIDGYTNQCFDSVRNPLANGKK